MKNEIKNQKSHIKHLTDCAEFLAGDNSILREFLHPAKAPLALRYSLAHAAVKPGVKTTPHRLKTSEVYYILRGQGRMHIGTEVSAVGADDTVYIPPQSVQFIENTGAEDLVFLCIVDPAWRPEDEEILTDPAHPLAVDVVLLPDEAMTKRVIEINRQLETSGPDRIALNPKDYLPHISLAMGCIDESDVESIRTRLETIAHAVPVKTLQAVGVTGCVNSRGGITCLLDIEKTPALQQLHEQVMDQMKPFFRYDVDATMLHDDAVAPSTLEWIRTFAQKAAYEHYDPHITLGYGQVPPDLSFPIPFTVARLALCHLGNHGTCRKILATVVL